MWFPCFGRKEDEKDIERFIYHHDNRLKPMGLIDEEFSIKENLDLSGINIWVCDTKLIIIYGKEDKINKLDPTEFVGKYIYDIEPKDIGQFFGDLHKKAQNAKESVKLNLLINEKIVYIVVKPILYFGEVIASILIIIPYKVDKKVLSTIDLNTITIDLNTLTL